MGAGGERERPLEIARVNSLSDILKLAPGKSVIESNYGAKFLYSGADSYRAETSIGDTIRREVVLFERSVSEDRIFRRSLRDNYLEHYRSDNFLDGKLTTQAMRGATTAWRLVSDPGYAEWDSLMRGAGL